MIFKGYALPTIRSERAYIHDPGSYATDVAKIYDSIHCEGGVIVGMHNLLVMTPNPTASGEDMSYGQMPVLIAKFPEPNDGVGTGD
jgi:hypothetical protein